MAHFSAIEVLMFRRAMERLYSDTCTVKVRRPIKNSHDVTTGYVSETIVENAPCRISYNATAEAAPEGSHLDTAQTITLFIAPDLVIPAGARVSVLRDGTAEPLEFWAAGIPAIYPTHQQIQLEAAEERA